METIDFSTFTEPGLYLLLPNGEQLALTRRAIEETTHVILADPNAIPTHIRAATEYAPCDICPERDTAVICHALMTTLPFFDDIDRYVSYDRVTAVYRDSEASAFIISETTMAMALQFVTILSLTSYCEVGREYGQYFKGINPLMPLNEIGKAVFQNIYFAVKGDVEKLQEVISEMSQNILHVARCQTERLQLISKGDAFANAFVNTDLITSFVNIELKAFLSGSA